MTNSLARRLAASLLLATLAVATVGCSTGSQSDDSGGAESAADTGYAAGDEPASDSLLGAPEAENERNGVQNASTSTTTQTASVISTGSVSLRGDDVEDLRNDVADIVLAHGGTIADEQSTTGGSEKDELRTARLVLRIPSSDFAATLDELKRLGTLDSVKSASKDVTTEVIDTQVRVAAQERSIARIVELLDRAKSIRDIMAIEAQLTDRQANLESLQSQQAWLADQTSLATISVEINRTDVPVATKEKDRGFLTGLATGWSGLKTFVVGTLTVLGVVLPFASVLALIGFPFWFLVRRFTRRPAPSPGLTPEV